MKPALRLLQHAHKIVLFSRANCSLCTDAKTVLSQVWERQPFEYEEIDVMSPGQQHWKDLYEFDTPVIHVEKLGLTGPIEEARKLMHRFRRDEVLQLMAETGTKSE